MTARIAAVDLGATSGRVITARVGDGLIDLTEVHRFPNRPVEVAGTLHWNILSLYQDVLEGLRAAGSGLASVGIDSWAVDYGLLDASGALLGNPAHYRDDRTEAVIDDVHAKISPERLYAVNGLQFLPFNTLYQLAAERFLDRAETLLLIPDLLAYWLTGERGAESTNASTTGLYDASSGTWSAEVIGALGLPGEILPPLRQPGTPSGFLGSSTGLLGVPLTAVASHDTASAVAAVPATGGNFAYISCGTWSLAGVELPAPILTEESRTANFTNEAGVDGTVRYLRNVMGMWLVSESMRTWGMPSSELPALLAAAAEAPGLRSVIDPNDPSFMPPGDMPSRITAYCSRTGQAAPGTRAETIRCIMDSLALAHRAVLREAAELSGHRIDTVHLVGGGSRNALLCQLTADATGLPVIAGPAEATALGNIGMQARALGLLPDLPALRALIAETQPLAHYHPTTPETLWLEAAARLGRTSGRQPH
ncbi:rhamnulokinase family protein [Actinocorallia aurantiaca]|uniref:Rhamnulokinase family protein n=1 Tax=Actinocorallia aurantiaca TaxID=46204 RepID=A0ABN3URD7_9ACTN